MAKKKPTSRTDAVRQAVDQAFQAQIPRERIGELLDELGHTAGRLRGAVDDLRPASADDVKSLRAELQELTARVAALETAAKPKAAARRPAAKSTAAKTAPSRSTAAKSEPAATPAKPRKTAATRSAPAASAAKPRKSPAKPKSSGAGS
jgi:translation initiation factor IF-2